MVTQHVSCRYVRVAVLPPVQATRCLFRTRGLLPQDVVAINEVFGMQTSHNGLRQKTLRVDICNTSKSGHEQCLVGPCSALIYRIFKDLNMFLSIRAEGPEQEVF